MSTTMKTPGVYVQELDAFGNSVVPVPTAIPVFIGYTGQTSYNGKSLINKPVKITSLTEFLSVFGDTPPQVQYEITSVILPERISNLETSLAVVTAAKTKADAAVTKAGAKATDAQKEAQKNADAAFKAVTDDLATAKADTEIAALIKAQDALAANKADPVPDALTKAVTDAQNAIDNSINEAEFISNGIAYTLSPETINYRMYSSMKYFYENGGADCYIMSIGGYDYTKKALKDNGAFLDAITLLEKETEPTMLVIPDLVEIHDPTITDTTSDTYLQDKYANAYSLQGEMINNCGKLATRIAILDIPGGSVPPTPGFTSSIDQFRNSVEPTEAKSNSYAAAYYPWMHTTVYQSSEISFGNISPASYPKVKEMLTIEYTVNGVLNQAMANTINAFVLADPNAKPPVIAPAGALSLEKADTILENLSKSYQLLISGIMKEMNLIGPSAAMAGIYTSVDNSEGVWVAPANVGVQSTVAPSITIGNHAQEDLNVPIDGKSICAIRAFTGEGIKVWGARTLDGNSNDWRYINIRRTMIYMEQSIKDAAKAYVFAPNTPSTWVSVESMISNFLTGLWNQGGIVGTKASDAFSVSIGLGSTMTNDDIQNGIMRVAVLVAVSHPAEFIEITFKQEMQK